VRTPATSVPVFLQTARQSRNACTNQLRLRSWQGGARRDLNWDWPRAQLLVPELVCTNLKYEYRLQNKVPRTYHPWMAPRVPVYSSRYCYFLLTSNNLHATQLSLPALFVSIYFQNLSVSATRRCFSQGVWNSCPRLLRVSTLPDFANATIHVLRKLSGLRFRHTSVRTTLSICNIGT